MNGKSIFALLSLYIALLAIASFAYFENLTRPPAAESPSGIDIDSFKPLAPTMTVNGITLQGEVGTFCWSNGFSHLCADAAGIPTQAEPVVLTRTDAPFLVQFQLDDLAPISDLGLYYYPVITTDALSDIEDDAIWWNFLDGGTQIMLDPAHETEIELALEPGLYVFNLFAIWEGQGDGSFGFLVEVQ